MKAFKTLSLQSLFGCIKNYTVGMVFCQEAADIQNECESLIEFDYHMSRKTLDHIEVAADGKLAVLLLMGTRVTV